MADNIEGRAQRPDLQNDDPFAELTRIMGHDPRQQHQENGDLSLDLEGELLGDLDLRDEPRDEPYGSERSTGAPAEEATQHLDAQDLDLEFASALDAGLDDEPETASGVAAQPVMFDDASQAHPADFARIEPQNPDAGLDTEPSGSSLDDFDFDALSKDLDAIDMSFEAQKEDAVREPAAYAVAQPSLEDELEQLLAGSTAPEDPAPYEPPSARAEQAPAPSEPGIPLPRDLNAPASELPRGELGYEASAAPDIETLEMADFEPAKAEPFDVPELPAEEPVQPQSDFDDLTAELNQAFEFMDDREDSADAAEFHPVRREDEATFDDHQYEWDEPLLATTADAVPHGAEVTQPQAQVANPHDLMEYEYEATDTRAAPAAQSRPVRSGGYVVAAGVVALLLVGGFGTYAWWWGGSSGDGEPVLLQADSEPTRVRPEDPGGTVVPNQDNEVYQRVAGGQEEARPSQERLIRTAEEPVDLTAQDAPLGTGVSATEEDRIAAVKSDERLDTALDDGISATNEDFVALQPRRVRTMVVRPDGTMVPREEPETVSTPDPVSEAGAGVMVRESEETSQPPSAEAAQDDVRTVAEQAGGAANEPEEVALAPATNSEGTQQQAADAGQPTPPAVVEPPPPAPRPEAEAQVAAIDPAPAPQSTQSSEWTMQIASQPSAESAQATYQDLARRYSSLLEGRGVNIVRANVEGRTYYRVRIPMASRDEAVNLCTRYQSAGGSCFVSR